MSFRPKAEYADTLHAVFNFECDFDLHFWLWGVPTNAALEKVKQTL